MFSSRYFSVVKTNFRVKKKNPPETKIGSQVDLLCVLAKEFDYFNFAAFLVSRK